MASLARKVLSRDGMPGSSVSRARRAVVRALGRGLPFAAVFCACGDDAVTTAPISLSAAEVAGTWHFTLTRDRGCTGEGAIPGTIPAVVRASERGDTLLLAGSWTGPTSAPGPWPLLGTVDRRDGSALIDFWSVVNVYGWRAVGSLKNDLTMRGRGVDPIPGSDPFFSEPPCGYALTAAKVQ